MLSPDPVRVSPVLKEMDTAVLLSPLTENSADTGEPVKIEPFCPEIDPDGVSVILSPNGSPMIVAKLMLASSVSEFTDAADMEKEARQHPENKKICSTCLCI